MNGVVRHWQQFLRENPESKELSFYHASFHDFMVEMAGEHGQSSDEADANIYDNFYADLRRKTS